MVLVQSKGRATRCTFCTHTECGRDQCIIYTYRNWPTHKIKNIAITRGSDPIVAFVAFDRRITRGRRTAPSSPRTLIHALYLVCWVWVTTEAVPFSHALHPTAGVASLMTDKHHIPHREHSVLPCRCCVRCGGDPTKRFHNCIRYIRAYDGITDKHHILHPEHSVLPCSFDSALGYKKVSAGSDLSGSIVACVAFARTRVASHS